MIGVGHFTYKDNGEWIEPVAVSDGTPAGAFETDEALVVASGHGVFVNENGVDAFNEVQDGDLTNNQIRGSRMVADQYGKFYPRPFL